jgi:hypothetical protein
MDSFQITDKEALSRLRPTVGKGKKKSKQHFRVHWVKLPVPWVKALRRSKSVNTYRLALTILIEAFWRDQTGGELVLSTEVTGMHRNSKIRAMDELVRLGLIKIKRDGRRAVRIVIIRIR